MAWQVAIAAGQALLGSTSAIVSGEQQKTSALTNNLIQNAAIEDANRRTKKIWNVQLDQAKEQFRYNKGSAERAYAATQLKQNEQLEAFLMQRRGILKTLMQVQGTYGAREVYGNTNERLKAINTEGSAGYAVKQLTDNLQRFSQQTDRDLAEIGRQWKYADSQAAANITVPPALQTQIPTPDMSLNGLNTALGIGSSVLGGIATGMALTPPSTGGAGGTKTAVDISGFNAYSIDANQPTLNSFP